MSEIRVYVRHIRNAKLCMNGARAWFAQEGIDWQKFLDEGAPIEFVDKIDDAFAQKVAAAAREEAANGHSV